MVAVVAVVADRPVVDRVTVGEVRPGPEVPPPDPQPASSAAASVTATIAAPDRRTPRPKRARAEPAGSSLLFIAVWTAPVLAPCGRDPFPHARDGAASERS